MTFRELERDVLSVHVWLRRTVLPTALVLVGVLLILRRSTSNVAELDHLSMFVSLMALWFVLVRGGHLLMVRSLHQEMKLKFEEAYAERLAKLPSLRRRNAGFALARIKRSLIDDGIMPNANTGQDAFPKDEDFPD